MGNPLSKYVVFKVIPCRLTSSFICLAKTKKNGVFLMKAKVNPKTFKLGKLGNGNLENAGLDVDFGWGKVVSGFL